MKEVDYKKIKDWKKNNNIFQSIKCALSGMGQAFKAEHNFFLYLGIAIVFLVFNIILKSSALEYVPFVILFACVFAAECVNTAIERIVDNFILTKDPNAKYIKDVAAAAVLYFGFAFFIAEGLILIPKVVG